LLKRILIVEIRYLGMAIDLYRVERFKVGVPDMYEVSLLDPRGREVYYFSNTNLLEVMENVLTFVDAYKDE
jgi:hypothetical protein